MRRLTVSPAREAAPEGNPGHNEVMGAAQRSPQLKRARASAEPKSHSFSWCVCVLTSRLCGLVSRWHTPMGKHSCRVCRREKKPSEEGDHLCRAKIAKLQLMCVRVDQ